MRFIAIFLTLGLGAAPAVHAQDHGAAAASEADRKAAARDAWREGNTNYNLGHYDEAAQHYEGAYRLVQDPAFLFNIAQSYRLGGKLELALDRYRAFLRTATTDSGNRETAQKFVDELKRKLEEKREPAPIVPSAGTPTNEPPPPAPSPAFPSGRSMVSPTPTSPPVGSPSPLTDSTNNLVSSPAQPKQADEASPFYKTWWFWSGAAAIVVAGTVTALVLANRSSSGPCSGTGLTCLEVR